MLSIRQTANRSGVPQPRRMESAIASAGAGRTPLGIACRIRQMNTAATLLQLAEHDDLG
jgi:hypothetical protein